MRSISPGWSVYTTPEYTCRPSLSSCMSTLHKRSSFFSQQPSLSSGSSGLLSGLGNHKWRLLLAVALYVAFLPLWWYSLGLIAIASGPLANLIYGFFDPRVSIYSDGRVL